MKTIIIGLGLIGGSIAKTLSSSEGYEVLAFDLDQNSIKHACLMLFWSKSKAKTSYPSELDKVLAIDPPINPRPIIMVFIKALLML